MSAPAALPGLVAALEADLRHMCQEAKRSDGFAGLFASNDHPVIKEAAERAMLKLRMLQGPGALDQIKVSKEVLRPLQLCCESGSPRLIAVALAAAQKLLSNDAVSPSGSEAIVDMIRKVQQSTDEGVQLKTLQTALTLLQSAAVPRDEAGLGAVLGACFGMLSRRGHKGSVLATAAATVRQSLVVLLELVDVDAELARLERVSRRGSSLGDEGSQTAGGERTEGEGGPVARAEGDAGLASEDLEQPALLVARAVLEDLCRVSTGTPPAWLATPSLPRSFVLDLLEFFLNASPSTLLRVPCLARTVTNRVPQTLAPQLTDALQAASRGAAFAAPAAATLRAASRASRTLLLRLHPAVEARDAADLLGRARRGLAPDVPVAHRAPCLDLIRAVISDPRAVAGIGSGPSCSGEGEGDEGPTAPVPGAPADAPTDHPAGHPIPPGSLDLGSLPLPAPGDPGSLVPPLQGGGVPSLPSLSSLPLPLPPDADPIPACVRAVAATLHGALLGSRDAEDENPAAGVDALLAAAGWGATPALARPPRRTPSGGVERIGGGAPGGGARGGRGAGAAPPAVGGGIHAGAPSSPLAPLASLASGSRGKDESPNPPTLLPSPGAHLLESERTSPQERRAAYAVAALDALLGFAGALESLGEGAGSGDGDPSDGPTPTADRAFPPARLRVLLSKTVPTLHEAFEPLLDGAWGEALFAAGLAGVEAVAGASALAGARRERDDALAFLASRAAEGGSWLGQGAQGTEERRRGSGSSSGALSAGGLVGSLSGSFSGAHWRDKSGAVSAEAAETAPPPSASGTGAGGGGDSGHRGPHAPMVPLSPARSAACASALVRVALRAADDLGTEGWEAVVGALRGAEGSGFGAIDDEDGGVAGGGALGIGGSIGSPARGTSFSGREDGANGGLGSGDASGGGGAASSAGALDDGAPTLPLAAATAAEALVMGSSALSREAVLALLCALQARSAAEAAAAVGDRGVIARLPGLSSMVEILLANAYRAPELWGLFLAHVLELVSGGSGAAGAAAVQALGRAVLGLLASGEGAGAGEDDGEVEGEGEGGEDGGRGDGGGRAGLDGAGSRSTAHEDARLRNVADDSARRAALSALGGVYASARTPEARRGVLRVLRAALQRAGDSIGTEGWEPVLRLLGEVPESRDPEALSVAFQCVQLAAGDYMASLPPALASRCLETVLRYGCQQSDVNVSLTTVSLLWNAADALDRAEAAAGRAASEAASGAGEEAAEEAPEGAAAGAPPTADAAEATTPLLEQTLRCLQTLAQDPRPEVRNSAVRTLFSVVAARGGRLSRVLWERCLWEMLFPLLRHAFHMSVTSSREESEAAVLGQSRGREVRMVLHHSHNSEQKQWDETVVMALGGTGRLLRAHARAIVGLPRAEAGWDEILVVVEGSVAGGRREVAMAALAVLLTLLGPGARAAAPRAADAADAVAEPPAGSSPEAGAADDAAGLSEPMWRRALRALSVTVAAASSRACCVPLPVRVELVGVLVAAARSLSGRPSELSRDGLEQIYGWLAQLGAHPWSDDDAVAPRGATGPGRTAVLPHGGAGGLPAPSSLPPPPQALPPVQKAVLAALSDLAPTGPDAAALAPPLLRAVLGLLRCEHLEAAAAEARTEGADAPDAPSAAEARAAFSPLFLAGAARVAKLAYLAAPPSARALTLAETATALSRCLQTWRVAADAFPAIVAAGLPTLTRSAGGDEAAAEAWRAVAGAYEVFLLGPPGFLEAGGEGAAATPARTPAADLSADARTLSLPPRPSSPSSRDSDSSTDEEEERQERAERLGIGGVLAWGRGRGGRASKGAAPAGAAAPTEGAPHAATTEAVPVASPRPQPPAKEPGSPAPTPEQAAAAAAAAEVELGVIDSLADSVLGVTTDPDLRGAPRQVLTGLVTLLDRAAVRPRRLDLPLSAQTCSHGCLRKLYVLAGGKAPRGGRALLVPKTALSLLVGRSRHALDVHARALAGSQGSAAAPPPPLAATAVPGEHPDPPPEYAGKDGAPSLGDVLCILEALLVLRVAAGVGEGLLPPAAAALAASGGARALEVPHLLSLYPSLVVAVSGPEPRVRAAARGALEVLGVALGLGEPL